MEEVNNSVGIEVFLEYNAQKLEAYLDKLRNETIKITAQIDVERLTSDIKAAIGDRLVAPVELELDSAKFEQKLDSLTKNRKLKVELEVDENQANKGIQSAAAGGNFEPQAIIKQIQDCCEHIQKAIREAAEIVSKSAMDGDAAMGLRNESISALKSAISGIGQTALFPIQKILTGSFEGIGQGLTRNLGSALSQSLSNSLKIDGEKVGTEIGASLGKAIRTQLEKFFPEFVNKFDKKADSRGQTAEDKETKDKISTVIKDSDRIFAALKIQLEGFKSVIIATQKQTASLESTIVNLKDAFIALQNATIKLSEKIQLVANKAGVTIPSPRTYQDT